MEQAQERAKTPPRAKNAKTVEVLEGVSGRLRIEVAGSASRLFEVRDGTVRPIEADGDADAVVTFDSEETFVSVLDGKKNPIVMLLQGRLRAQGDLAMATKVLLTISATEVRS